MIRDIQRLVDKTPFVDTHEHLWEEKSRIAALQKDAVKNAWAPDFGLLFCHYANSDLLVAGMPADDMTQLFSYDVEVDDKWKLFAPWYERSRHTGYVQCVRESVQLVFDEDDLDATTYRRISEKVRAQIGPGYYKPVLREKALVEHTHVNSLEGSILQETEYPDLLCQDLSIVAMSTGISNASIIRLCELAHRSVASLKDWYGIIDWCFETYGPRAIALKSQSAYGRRLNFDLVDEATAAPLFEAMLKDEKAMTPEQVKALQDHLFHYVVEKSIETNLPIKLHTGYYAGQGGMPLERVKANLSDLCPIFKQYPNARFVVMHIAYPYQDEAIAVAKHYPNVYIDLCWAWIINPLASVRFTKEFLMAVPHNKLLTFGGDYIVVELVPGHARIARRGLAQAVSELIKEDWLREREAPELIDRIMRGNAHELFDYEGTLQAWNKA